MLNPINQAIKNNEILGGLLARDRKSLSEVRRLYSGILKENIQMENKLVEWNEALRDFCGDCVLNGGKRCGECRFHKLLVG